MSEGDGFIDEFEVDGAMSGGVESTEAIEREKFSPFELSPRLSAGWSVKFESTRGEEIETEREWEWDWVWELLWVWEFSFDKSTGDGEGEGNVSMKLFGFIEGKGEKKEEKKGKEKD